MFRERTTPAMFGIVRYPSVKPIDVGAIDGGLSIARPLLPDVHALTLAARPGPLALAGGIEVGVDDGLALLYGRETACDVARAIKRDRAWVANPAALGVVVPTASAV